ncbi:MAG: DUF2339 domain-containing protein, partial [Candidatus Omnitrophica bacterium]|nr:DUF2339 domain-containing protein [Candidatus Omnitrophota bacterium]
MMIIILWVGIILATMMVAEKKKLSMTVFFILAVFLGPIGLIVALLSKEQTELGPASNPKNFTVLDARMQLAQLKHALNTVQHKMNALDQKIHHLSAAEEALSEDVKNDGASGALTVEKDTPTDDTPSPKQSAEPSMKMKQRERAEGFEVQFAKYWLNRLGVIIFVIGIGLFISYTFQYLNAWAKISIGFVFSAVFLWLGNLLERKGAYTKVAWGIIGGGWGLMYLSVYAMHFIEATRVIDNPYLECLLLMIVSAAAVFFNLKYASWVVTAMTFSLAFISAGLGGLNGLSVVYFTLLTGAVALIAYLKKWFPFLIYGIIGSYLTHAWVKYPLIGPGTVTHSPSSASFTILFTILALTWMIYQMVLFILKADSKEKIGLWITAFLLNAGMFVTLGLRELHLRSLKLSAGAIDEPFWFTLVLAGL